MIGALDIAADLTVSVGDGKIRVHGEHSRLAVNADSWRSLLRMRSFAATLESFRGVFPPGDGDVLVSVRGIEVASIRLRGSRRRLRPHPLGVIRSLLGR